jgi:hypothetical protein
MFVSEHPPPEGSSTMSTATKTIRQTKIVKDSAAKARKNSTDKVPAKTAAVKAEKPKIRNTRADC